MVVVVTLPLVVAVMTTLILTVFIYVDLWVQGLVKDLWLGCIAKKLGLNAETQEQQQDTEISGLQIATQRLAVATKANV